MRRVPDAWLFEPWRMPPLLQAQYGVRVGHDIAMPLVDLSTATREAKQRMYALRAQPTVKAAKAAIVEKHGSRKLPDRAQGRRKTRNPESQSASAQSNATQLGFEF
jgi:deoxyribodipyrimidine photo-lyase